MDNHQKKMIAPIVISAVFVAYLIIYLIAILTAVDFHPVMVLFAIPLVALAIGMCVTLQNRIKEIRSGEEDDLDNY